jgi:two-component sensor histidine kinase
MAEPLHGPRTVEYSAASAPSAEADHRVANSLSVIAGLVRLRASRTSGVADPKALLLEVADRIDTVARLHRHMAHARQDEIRLGGYLQEIGDSLCQALSRPGTKFTIACPPEVSASFKVALPLGLITAELFSNSLKYAHPAGLPVKIALSCNQDGVDGLTFVYEDDGVGFPEGFDVAQDGHLGMRFIRLLSDQLNAERSWDSTPLGVRFEITVPPQGRFANGGT